MAPKLFSCQNKNSSNERDSLTPRNMHLTPCNIFRLLNVYCEIFGTSSYGERRTSLGVASASPPYERVPNISQYTFNNLFIIYHEH